MLFFFLHSPHPEICLLLLLVFFFSIKFSLYFILYIWNCVRCVFSGHLAQYRQPLFSLSHSLSFSRVYPNIPFSPSIPASRYYGIYARNSVTSMMKWQNKQNPGEQEIIGQWKNASSFFALCTSSPSYLAHFIRVPNLFLSLSLAVLFVSIVHKMQIDSEYGIILW